MAAWMLRRLPGGTVFKDGNGLPGMKSVGIRCLLRFVAEGALPPYEIEALFAQQMSVEGIGMKVQRIYVGHLQASGQLVIVRGIFVCLVEVLVLWGVDGCEYALGIAEGEFAGLFPIYGFGEHGEEPVCISEGVSTFLRSHPGGGLRGSSGSVECIDGDVPVLVGIYGLRFVRVCESGFVGYRILFSGYMVSLCVTTRLYPVFIKQVLLGVVKSNRLDICLAGCFGKDDAMYDGSFSQPDGR